MMLTIPPNSTSFLGSADNKVRFWHIPDYQPNSSNGNTPPLTNLFAIAELDGHPAAPTRVVRFNPRHASESILQSHTCPFTDPSPLAHQCLLLLALK